MRILRDFYVHLGFAPYQQNIVWQIFHHGTFFSDEERRQLKDMVRDDLIHYQKQTPIAGLQILFLFKTGLRIGECCGLKWSDIKRQQALHTQAKAIDSALTI